MLLMQRIRKIRMVILGGLAAFLIHLIFLFVLISSTKLGIIAVALGLLVFWLVPPAPPPIRRMESLKRPGYVLRFRSGILLPHIPVCHTSERSLVSPKLVVCMLIYLVLMILLRGIREDELEDMPGGRVII